ncbi:MAG: phenylalanine--tRNA ligase beta subunit-related protein [Bacteroidetes bacterium]|nr:phenylalanine--tRNA ligase beta subunit-related protein [Bacteroidota bacterium]
MPSNRQLQKVMDEATARSARNYVLSSLETLEQIKSVRQVYKSLGKDPSRYRGSAEALLRRVLQNKGLYRINNVVDVNNIISLESLHPVGSYDVGCLEPPVWFRIGQPGETYKGIGKELINIQGLPVFSDTEGAFGSPTADSERAMIRTSSSRIQMVVISFVGEQRLHEWIDRATSLLKNFAAGANLESSIIKS